MNRSNSSSQERGLIILIGLALLASGVVLFLTDERRRPELDSRPIVLENVRVIAPVFTEIGKVNVNEATAEELECLPGIGKTLAARIIAYRNEHGPFSSLDELEKVSGIGKETIERLRPYAEAR